MTSKTFSTLEIACTREDHKDEDILALYRFMVWAYEEADNTLDDEFLKAAIHTIIYYLSKHYEAGLKTNH